MSNTASIQSAGELLAYVDEVRATTSAALDAAKQSNLGQYFTPAVVAQLMADMVEPVEGDVQVLDPGAGVGPLLSAVAVHLVSGSPPPVALKLVAHEIDDALFPALERVLGHVAKWCEGRGVPTRVEIRKGDFLSSVVGAHVPTLDADPGSGAAAPHDVVILNPPYMKLARDVRERRNARQLGVEAPNMYAAFWAAAIRAARPGGQVVSITPRSFCNGTYFADFRRWLLASGSLARLHVFDSREAAFCDDGVLQENVITKMVVGRRQSAVVEMTAQSSPAAPVRRRSVAFDRVVQESDGQRFIHVIPDQEADVVAERMSRFDHALNDLGLAVSTGRVVDFRADELLRQDPGPDTVPLIYPTHMQAGRISWPLAEARKPNAIIRSASIDRGLLVPDGDYTLVKRFTAKEERRRVVAAVYESGRFGSPDVGFENHLNYLHREGQGLGLELALGLAVYLNTTLVDSYLRQFSGHTQVNAGDLRFLRYPSLEALKEAGATADLSVLKSQEETDALAAQVFGI